MKAHRIKAVIRRHLYEARRNFDRISEIVYWPVIDIIVWGFLTVYLARQDALGPTVFNFLLGATILWGAFFAFQRDVALGFLDELWARNILNLFSSPLTIPEYMTGLITVNFFKMVGGFLAASLLAFAFYSFNIFPFALPLLPFFFNLLLFALAVGIMITAMIFRYSTKIQTLAWGFAGLLQPVSCVFYPLATLPSFLQGVAWLMPATHSFEGMRQILAGGGFSYLHFWWALGLNFVYFVFALVLFGFIFKVAKTRGLLVKLE
ncbi:ABC transporter permease [Candidatus Giovannonibacteria bacterium]|nr:ABC transporter permease [Candidatus Giovannonibacteria bacterium]